MAMGSNSSSIGVGGAALWFLVSLNAASSPGIAMPRTRTDFRGDPSSASAEQLRWNPWAQAEIRNAMVALFRRTQDPESLMGTDYSLPVASTVVDVQSTRYVSETHVAGQSVQTTSEIIVAVRSALGLQITELASILHVQRPTIYAWVDDRATPHPQNRERLHQLYRVVREWEQLSDRPLSARLRHVAQDGKSLLDLLTANIMSEPDVSARLKALALQKKTPGPARRGLSARALAGRYGIRLPSESEQQLNIDRITGKRTSME